ncbi:S8 family serine peptidase [Bradyrhizobium sp. 24]|uniref:S8 family serine peptidase n=1 Tax=unclassified Bradyrhizobium TaxID=2631580 RepID=UPI001FF762C9|nr:MULTISPECIES: S8 family serine peptidase [unclassified Bradyrhizobium]MCK1302049.1 S8 family serine peptidase [Bradyrhizobium sp. 37]MCK1378652.1 S8 family serine peptidase [Bradyrhizobium sp. 24]MCK1773370.1 S8 family serine peptidase [Bradyrhizobium sp. 134]
MNETFLPKHFAYSCRSVPLRLLVATLLVAAPLALASAQTVAPAEGASAGQNSAVHINPDNEGDPISLEAVQDGVNNFELRQADIGPPNAISADGIKRRGFGPTKSDESGADRLVLPVDRKPPRDALPHRSTEATTVQTEAPNRPLSAAKDRPKPPADYPSRGASDVRPFEAYRLGFSGGTTTPATGIDPRIRSDLAAGERTETYAFLLMESLPDAATERALMSEFGVASLGLHGTALKVRVPLQAQALEGIARLPGFRSLAYPSPDQKLAPELKFAIERLGAEVARFPIIISLFETDSKAAFAERVQATGTEVGRYDPVLRSYEALATPEQIRILSGLDFILFIEIERRSGGGHDQSMATNGVDYIRASGFLGAGTVLGLLDTGAMLGSAAATMHQDLNKNGCGINFTSDTAGVWNDQNGHGTHVLATISGTGTAKARFRGVATAVGSRERIRVGKIWKSTNTGQNSWLRDAIDYMADATSCDAPRPSVINLSGGASGSGQTGTDSESRKLDARVWETRQAYIVCSGNNGPGAQSIWSPGVAKNALTVGNVQDSGSSLVGELSGTSSRGPTGDNRMKPDLVATGAVVTSAQAGTTDGYVDKSGCSMATPHVSGIAATLLEHYPDFRDRPHLLRAHLMASATLHSDEVSPANNTGGGRNDFGLGRVSDYQSHWARLDPNGWSGHWAWMTITDKSWGFFDINVPRGTKRVVAVLTWDEPEASAGASQAVTYDVDLWADPGASCTPDAVGQCGAWASQSNIDNVEYLIIDNPPPGVLRLKAINWRAPSFGLPVAIAAKIIRGDPTPAISMTATPSTTSPSIGSTFTIKTTISNPSYEAYGVQVSAAAASSGLSLLGVSTTREDGVAMDFPNAASLTLGTVTEADTRSAIWKFSATSRGPQTVRFSGRSNNGGTVFKSVTVTP